MTSSLTAEGLRIAIDARAIGPNFPGIGRATLGLVRGLHQIDHGAQVVVAFLPEQRDVLAPTGIEHDPRFTCFPLADEPQSLGQQWRIPVAARRMHADVWHAPYYFRPFWGLPPTVVTVFDMIGPASLHVGSGPRDLKVRVEHVAWRLAMQLSLQSAKQIITSSEATRRALKAAYQLAENKIRVIPLAADDLFRPPSAEQIARVRRHYALPERYLLYLGSNKPHKNLLGLLDAWASVLATGLIEESMCLVLAGRESPRFASTRNRVRALGIESRVRFLPDLPDEELPSLLGGAECFVFPSLQEGFGLPPLEAMACGTPVIVANRSSLPEVVGDAGLLVEPDPAGLADGIRRLLADGVLRRELRERGIRRAGEFSWRRTAAETLRVYQQAAR